MHMENPNAAVVDIAVKAREAGMTYGTVCSEDGRHGSCGKTQKNIKTRSKISYKTKSIFDILRLFKII